MENEKQRKAPATKVHPDAIETIGAVRHDDSGVVPPSAAPFDERDGPLEYATVSTGHTVHVPTGERVMSGYDSTTGKYCYRQVFQIFGPGDQVRLPRAQIERLKSSGHLLDPDRKVEPAPNVVPAQGFGDKPPGPVN